MVVGLHRFVIDDTEYDDVSIAASFVAAKNVSPFPPEEPTVADLYARYKDQTDGAYITGTKPLFKHKSDRSVSVSYLHAVTSL